MSNKQTIENILAGEAFQALMKMALEEDIGSGDVTTLSLAGSHTAVAEMVPRSDVVFCGGPVARTVFEAVDSSLQVEQLVDEGQAVPAGIPVLRISGPAGSILTGERLALNFAQRLTGISTLTARFMDLVREHGTRLLDTRKTTPGFRLLEKYAVHCGGGTNHRIGLYDQVLIKDNHLVYWQAETGQGLAEAVAESRRRYPDLKIEIEADTVDQVKDALASKPDWILLDNMSLEELRSCVDLCAGVCQTEASGGVNIDTVAGIAATGVDAISVGQLTHSVMAADLGLDFL